MSEIHTIPEPVLLSLRPPLATPFSQMVSLFQARLPMWSVNGAVGHEEVLRCWDTWAA